MATIATFAISRKPLEREAWFEKDHQ